MSKVSRNTNLGGTVKALWKFLPLIEEYKMELG